MPAPVLTERHGRVLVITLHRPEVRNAIDQAMAEGLAAALDELDGDDAVAAGVLTGSGRGFCAGLDLKAFADGQRLAWVPDRGFAGIVHRSSRKPLVAAIEGFALAGGFEIVLACDLVVAARDARMGIPEVTRGLVAIGGGLLHLARRIPYHVAMELALTGEPMDATALHAHGLVNRLSEPGAALAGALELADRVAANAPLAVDASKRILQAIPDWTTAEAWRRQEEIFAPVMASDDAGEGARAFAERRAPVWRGR